MPRLKLTSPGALLIVATGMAGAILLLDVFFLRPYVVAQKDAALSEVAFRTVQGINERLQSEQDRLVDLARSHAQSQALQDSPETLAAFGRNSLAGEAADLAWVRDRAGTVCGAWSRRPPSSLEANLATLAEEVRRALGGGTGASAKGGLVRLGGRVAVFTQVGLGRNHSPFSGDDDPAASEGGRSAAGPIEPIVASSAEPPVVSAVEPPVVSAV